MGCVIRAALIAVASCAALLTAGCVGDPVGHIRIVNDTGRSALIARCRSQDCHGDFASKATLAPHERGGEVNVSVIGVPNVFAVLEPGSERRLGCLPLVMPHQVTGLIARVSQMVSCKKSYNEDQQWPPG